MDENLAKLEFLRDGYWKLFTQTGSVFDYGKYRSARELVKNRKLELENQQERLQ